MVLRGSCMDVALMCRSSNIKVETASNAASGLPPKHYHLSSTLVAISSIEQSSISPIIIVASAKAVGNKAKFWSTLIVFASFGSVSSLFVLAVCPCRCHCSCYLLRLHSRLGHSQDYAVIFNDIVYIVVAAVTIVWG